MPSELSMPQIRRVVMEEATRGAQRAALATERAVKGLVPVKTGQARRSITGATVPTISGNTIRVHIGSNVPHVRYLDEGTGEFGPKHRKITPQARQALAFVAGSAKGPGAPFTLAGRLRNAPGRAGDATAALGGLVVRRSVRGVMPMRFILRGYEASREARLVEIRAIGPRISARLGVLGA